MKKKLLVLFTICLFMVSCLYGCGKKEVDPNRVVKSLKDLNSYTCDVDINIKNTRQGIKFECKQFYDKRYGGRLDLNGDRKFIYRKNDIVVNDLKNDKEYIVDKKFDSVYKLSFIQEYINLLYTNEEIRYSTQTTDDKVYQLIHLIIPGNNRNINKAIMYVNIENNLPEKTIICDIKGNEAISFVYKNFTTNPKLEKEIFVDKHTNE
ncbi:germination lipoprotein GerS-related protein [Clostridium sp. MB40-C1]|uniref:germination lipoprotein GerS-related protein n=1 Tax=Clostridium sp. MB40-C1 TaxID=3070996 RepID=UPI0027E1A16C|nr:germination lipoprotein GerS-related protein [Clostridium sp. MB40-C1]WMJ80498.1 germination lipoprotein GerS-related protein [Clostridium sp. MB40-C1]